MDEKREFYKRYGVEEYYVYDPASGLLEGWRRRANQLRKIPRIGGFTSPRLAVRFQPGDGPDNLKIIARNGEPFITPLEMSRELAAERIRAEAERIRAEAFAAKLRELGIDP
jgi:Uma2 family endonuclease